MSRWQFLDLNNIPYKPGEKFDVWAKKWDHNTDSFVWQRFTDVSYEKTGIITPSNPNPGIKWPPMMEGWYPTHHMAIPEPPEKE